VRHEVLPRQADVREVAAQRQRARVGLRRGAGEDERSLRRAVGKVGDRGYLRISVLARD
jgi:hypothetical protein